MTTQQGVITVLTDWSRREIQEVKHRIEELVAGAHREKYLLQLQQIIID